MVTRQPTDASMDGPLPPGAWWVAASKGMAPKPAEPYGPRAGPAAIEAAKAGPLELRDVAFSYPLRPGLPGVPKAPCALAFLPCSRVSCAVAARALKTDTPQPCGSRLLRLRVHFMTSTSAALACKSVQSLSCSACSAGECEPQPEARLRDRPGRPQRRRQVHSGQPAVPILPPCQRGGASGRPALISLHAWRVGSRCRACLPGPGHL